MLYNSNQTRRDMLRATGAVGIAALAGRAADAPAKLEIARPLAIDLDPDRLQVAYDLLEKWTTGPDAPVPGAAILVGRHGKIVPPRFFGRMGPERDAQPIRKDAIFVTASISKPITYLGAMLLVERGQLNLSDRVTRYIPEFAAHGKEETLVLHLFTHTSGLPDMLPNNAELRKQHAPLKKFIEGAILETKPLFKPGTKLSYQSMGTLVVAEIVQRLSGRPIAEFLRREIFLPLGLKSTNLGSGDFPPERLVRVQEPAYLAGRDYGWNSPYWRKLGAPWGTLFSTPEDFAAICQLFLAKGRHGNIRLLSPASVRMMTTNRLNDLPDLPETDRRTRPWGLGWRLNHLGTPGSWSDLLGRHVFGHTGATGTTVWMDPKRDGFCILLTSAERAAHLGGWSTYPTPYRRRLCEGSRTPARLVRPLLTLRRNLSYNPPFSNFMPVPREGQPAVRRILVTGGAGYVGCILVPKLLRAGYRVTVYDLMLYGADGLAPHPRLDVIEADLRDTLRYAKTVAGHDAVIHLACISNDPSFELDPSWSRSINYAAFEPMVAASKKAGVRRFIYASTSSVYGVSDAPEVTEEHPLIPLTDYNKFKGLCEPILLRYQSPAFTTVIIRPATVCGYSPRMRLDLTVNILTNHAVHNRLITVFGGSQKRPNIHIQDIADLYVQLLELPDSQVAGETFNAGCQNYTVRELAEMVRAVVEREMPEKAPIRIATTSSNDHRSYHVSSKKIAEHLGFVPRRTVEDAVRDLCAAFRTGKLPNSLGDERYLNVKYLKQRAA